MSREAGRATDILTSESSAHEKALFKCRIAENAERFDDMVASIKEACKASTEPLGPNERNYLSVAYKNSVATRRAALRCLAAMKSKYEARNATQNVEIVNEYYKQVLDELEKICEEVLDLIENVIMRPEIVDKLPDDRTSRELKVFFLKMSADYYRYLCEFAEPEKKKQAVQKAEEYYNKAVDLATNGPEGVILPAPHPIRLGLMLNFSVFLYEILEKIEQAKGLAKTAFDLALDNLDSAGEIEYKDSTLILQLLRDNCTLWSSQDGDNAGPGGEASPAQPDATAAQQPPAEEHKD